MKINWIKVLKITGFVASGFISFKLMTTLCETKMDYILAFSMTLVLQSSSFYFFNKALLEFNLRNRNKKYLYTILATLLFIFSIIGTISFQFALQNKAVNDLMLNSSNYKQQQVNKQLNIDLVNTKKEEIENIKLNYNSQISAIDESIADYRKLEKAQNQLYTTKIETLNKSKNELIAGLSYNLKELNKDLEKLTQVAISPTLASIDSLQLEHTKGYLGMLSKIAKWTNIDLDILSLILQIFAACLFELTAICLHIEDTKIKLNVTPKNTQNVLQADFKPKKINIEKQEKQEKQVIGFNPAKTETKPTKPSKLEIETYLDCMFNNSKDGHSPGYKKISNLTSLSQENCRKIKGHLEQLNVIETQGTRTHILKSRGEIEL